MADAANLSLRKTRGGSHAIKVTNSAASSEQSRGGRTIVDAEGTRANRSDKIAVTETMMERVEQCFDLKSEASLKLADNT